MSRRCWGIFVFASLLSLAAQAGSAPEPASAEPTAAYVVRLPSPPLVRRPGVEPGRLGSLDARLHAASLTAEQDQALAAIRQSAGRSVREVHRYGVAFNGLAVELTDAEAAKAASLPGIVAVERSRVLVPASDAGPAWIGAPAIWDGTGTGGLPGTQGEGIVLGILDTGINLTHPSFADVGGDGFDHTNPRGAGNFVGWCDPGNPDFDPSLPCNDKLIGVWSYPEAGGDPRDDDGHGSAVASIAAGNRLPAAAVSFPSITINRPVSGVAPHANLISYDVCGHSFGSTFCPETAVLAAIDQAVADGVDVINLSATFSGFSNPWDDSIALSLLGAREAGVLAAVAEPDSFSSLEGPRSAPWALLSAAATHDRRFVNSLVGLSGGATPPPADIVGMGETGGYGPATIVDAGDFGDSFCESPFPAGTFAGEIVACQNFFFNAIPLVENVLAGGGGAVVFADIFGNGPFPGTHPLPTVYISSQDSSNLFNWLASGSGHMGRITGLTADLDPTVGDILFFVLGGPGSVEDVLKPDVTAPGADILAATEDAGSFALLSGASMASAHAAGAAALLLDLHPGWTPAEVQSALMITTVRTRTFEFFGDVLVPSTPFQEGAGRIDIAVAARAGLVLDETVPVFEAAESTPSALNLASLAEGFCLDSCTWTRVVRSTLPVAAQWTVATEAPAGITVTVTPSSFSLAPGATQLLEITLSGQPATFGSSWQFGAVTLTEAGGLAPPARLPIAAFVIQRFLLSVGKAGLGTGRVTSTPSGIDCGGDCFEEYPDDSSVTLTAIPDPGSVFAGWSGACSFAGTTCNLSMFSNRFATAFFVPRPPDVPLANRVPVKDSLDGPVENGLFKFYFADVPPGTGALVVDLFDVTADAVLFVQFGAKPDHSQAQCASFASAFDDRMARCVIDAPQAGRWWIGVNNDDAGFFEYTVRASWGNAMGSEGTLSNGGSVDDFVIPFTNNATFKYYALDLEPGSVDLLVELLDLSADADLYLRHGLKPDTAHFDCASTAGSTQPDRCLITHPAPGRWWVGVTNFSVDTVVYELRASWTQPPATSFFTVTPCRAFDSRAGAPLQSNALRTIAVGGTCGIPATARAVSANVTVVVPTGLGHLTLFPTGAAVPDASTINFSAGQVRANNALLSLALDGSGTISAVPVILGDGAVNVIVDVNGYFE